MTSGSCKNQLWRWEHCSFNFGTIDMQTNSRSIRFGSQSFLFCLLLRQDMEENNDPSCHFRRIVLHVLLLGTEKATLFSWTFSWYSDWHVVNCDYCAFFSLAEVAPGLSKRSGLAILINAMIPANITAKKMMPTRMPICRPGPKRTYVLSAVSFEDILQICYDK